MGEPVRVVGCDGHSQSNLRVQKTFRSSFNLPRNVLRPTFLRTSLPSPGFGSHPYREWKLEPVLLSPDELEDGTPVTEEKTHDTFHVSRGPGEPVKVPTPTRPSSSSMSSQICRQFPDLIGTDSGGVGGGVCASFDPSFCQEVELVDSDRPRVSRVRGRPTSTSTAVPSRT